MIKLSRLHNVLFGVLIILSAACRSNDQRNFEKLISVKSDTLKINNLKDTLIVGLKGTALFFEKESFQLPNGTTPGGNISIVLKECYSNSDIVRENLATTTGGKLLETRGMINITAFSNDQELILKKGKKFIIHFPKNSSERKKQMNLFYGKSDANGTVDWKLDSVTLLKPTSYISGWMTTGYPGGDTSNNGGFYFKGQKADSIFNYFYKNFDNTKLKSIKDNGLDRVYDARFIVNKQGKITNVKITEEDYDNSGRKRLSKSNVDPYFYTYIEHIPPVEPFYEYNENHQLKPFNADCDFYFSMGLYPPDYRNNKNYNEIFNKKYNAFKKSAITSMNEAELNYYIFSSTKLGWINCDFLWQVQDEKIDYYVKANAKLKANIKLVFIKAKSILTGTAEGDEYVFKNVPINQEVKIVAIAFDSHQPLMAVAKTTTYRAVFGKLDYKAFTIGDLEKEINIP
jgi:hypothetical protein